MLEQLTTLLVFQALLILCRVGSIMVMLPGIGESAYPFRSRLLFAIAFALILIPVLHEHLPPIPTSAAALLVLLASEIVIGLFIGSMARILLSVMHTAGMIMSYQMGLAAATLFDPSQGSQGSIIGSFLAVVALVMIFTTNLHHVFIYGMVDSYTLFSPSDAVPWGDFAEYAGKLVSETFSVAFRIASPLVISGLLVFLAAGVMARIMPQMQVFFVLIPVQIMLGFFILLVTLSSTMMWYMNYVGDTYGTLLIP